MTTADTQGTTHPRDGWVVLGMTVSATAATLTSFDGLRQLALAAGWADVMAPLLPATVDAFAATATRIWLAKSTVSKRARRFSSTCAIGAILLSLGGNACYHLVAANLLQVSWIMVFCVGAIPPVILGLISHIAVLRTQHDIAAKSEPSMVLSPVLPTISMSSTLANELKPAAAQEKAVAPRPRTTAKRRVAVPRHKNEDQLLQAAEAADAKYRAANGTGITRDELRRALRIGSEPATTLLRRLKEVRTEPVEP